MRACWGCGLVFVVVLKRSCGSVCVLLFVLLKKAVVTCFSIAVL